MYESQFGFSDRPFGAAPRVDRYYPAASIEEARQALSMLIERASGIGSLIGPSGCGKSLLLKVLARQYEGTFEIALLSGGNFSSPRGLLQAICYEVGLPYRGMEETELRLSLVDHLGYGSGAISGLLLLVDEAHTYDERLLEELRQLTNVVSSSESRVRCILAGNLSLEENLGAPALDSLNQRIAARCYLEPLDTEQTAAYIASHLAKVHANRGDVFRDDARRAVHRATAGIPRLINQVCDHALVLAFAGGRTEVDSAGIEEAWADLQQLPAPWNDSSDSHRSGNGEDSFIEFGSLDSDDDGEVPLSGSADDFTRDPAIVLDEIDHHLTDVASDLQSTTGPSSQSRSWAADSSDLQPPRRTMKSDPVAANPFIEPFDQEEVVLDQYADFEDAVRGRMQVESSEGRELSALLAPIDAAIPSPTLCIVADEEHGIGPAVERAATPPQIMMPDASFWQLDMQTICVSTLSSDSGCDTSLMTDEFGSSNESLAKTRQATVTELPLGDDSHCGFSCQPCQSSQFGAGAPKSAPAAESGADVEALLPRELRPNHAQDVPPRTPSTDHNEQTGPVVASAPGTKMPVVPRRRDDLELDVAETDDVQVDADSSQDRHLSMTHEPYLSDESMSSSTLPIRPSLIKRLPWEVDEHDLEMEFQLDADASSFNPSAGPTTAGVLGSPDSPDEGDGAQVIEVETAGHRARKERRYSNLFTALETDA